MPNAAAKVSLGDLRLELHDRLCERLIHLGAKKRICGVTTRPASFADLTGSRLSSALAGLTAERMSHRRGFLRTGLSDQAKGAIFRDETRRFLGKAMQQLAPAVPGDLYVLALAGDGDEGGASTGPAEYGIDDFEQYSHLAEIRYVAENNPDVRDALGSEYLIRSDIAIARRQLTQADFGRLISKQWAAGIGVGADSLVLSGSEDAPKLLLHGIVSTKFTFRSDRAQNIRTEALGALRHRKLRAPHIVAVTLEPLPNRLASLCEGTGDIDCVYHGALPELQRAATKLREVLDEQDEKPSIARLVRKQDANKYRQQLDRLEGLVLRRRLRDIAALPLDLLA